MNSAYLFNGKIIAAKDYNPRKHGSRIYCIDKTCKKPVIYIPGKKGGVGYFKTTGKGDSKHVKKCGFYEPLDVLSCIEKVNEYQKDFLEKGANELVIRLSMNKIDPDYKATSKESVEDGPKKKKDTKSKVDEPKQTPSNISSLKTVLKLFSGNNPDILAGVLIRLPGGHKVPLSNLILNQQRAHEVLWKEKEKYNTGYFVYGVIESVQRREKVIYINFEEVNQISFTLLVFERYFTHFTYTDDQLIGKKVITYGKLQKNKFKKNPKTELLIKSDKYIEFIK